MSDLIADCTKCRTTSQEMTLSPCLAVCLDAELSSSTTVSGTQDLCTGLFCLQICHSTFASTEVAQKKEKIKE